MLSTSVEVSFVVISLVKAEMAAAPLNSGSASSSAASSAKSAVRPCLETIGPWVNAPTQVKVVNRMAAIFMMFIYWVLQYSLFSSLMPKGGWIVEEKGPTKVGGGIALGSYLSFYVR